jgi:2-alkyl-3-oxoalkanoate reductase
MMVLVTGGGGFLGGAIVRQLLARGDAVRVLARGSYPALADEGAELVRGDITSASTVSEAVAGCDAIVHVAAKVGGWGDRSDFHAVNVRGTEHVIAAAREHGAGRLVYTSTPSVVHAGSDLNGVDEAVPYAERFLAAYPETKAMAERTVLAAHGRGLATVALRPHLVWGPGDNHLLPRTIARARAGKLRLLSGPPKFVDQVFVDDAAAAHLCALDRLGEQNPACGGRAYFISSGDPIESGELINRVLGAVGAPAATKRVPPWVAAAAGWAFEHAYRLVGRRDEPPITRFAANQLMTSHYFDISAARRDLGWSPVVSFAEGLERLARES